MSFEHQKCAGTEFDSTYFKNALDYTSCACMVWYIIRHGVTLPVPSLMVELLFSVRILSCNLSLKFILFYCC